jgi:hypothetical protein
MDTVTDLQVAQWGEAIMGLFFVALLLLATLLQWISDQRESHTKDDDSDNID